MYRLNVATLSTFLRFDLSLYPSPKERDLNYNRFRPTFHIKIIQMIVI
jgi:hypothetical protein